MADFLTELEKAIANRQGQLSPEKRKIQSKVNLERMGKQQIDIRNAKAQAYLDKKAAEKLPSMASRAGRASAQAQRAVVEGTKKFGKDLAKSVKSDIVVGKKALQKAAPKVVGASRFIGRLAVPVDAAIEATRTARYLTDEDYRNENQKAYEEMAQKPALQRALEGAGGGMATILTQSKNLLETSAAGMRAAESGKAAEEGKRRLIAKGILDEKGRPTRLKQNAEQAAPEFDGEALSRALIEAPPVPSPETAPRTAGGEALSKALIEAPPVQSAETAPRTADVEAAYKEIEAGNVPKAIVVDESKLEAEPVELDENRMAQLYRKTTGAEYNPEVSKAAREKMAQLKSFVSTNPEMLNKSDTRIALDFYRTLK